MAVERLHKTSATLLRILPQMVSVPADVYKVMLLPYSDTALIISGK